ncbi:hypothetical protein LGR54_23365 [Ancylobacter sp. Lp-2]|uniref:hypothetical protein n=1 Tax=Ancylobacter sp. Lp-2 TaxID=2881339 RepID=UPI001E565BF0|nr:hypothetical protein [Ancylobacter sp. Lp-2]MCB4771554.1 hypothetical protein [Ancylobacter sp. Lp-2]
MLERRQPADRPETQRPDDDEPELQRSAAQRSKIRSRLTFYRTRDTFSRERIEAPSFGGILTADSRQTARREAARSSRVRLRLTAAVVPGAAEADAVSARYQGGTFCASGYDRVGFAPEEVFGWRAGASRQS